MKNGNHYLSDKECELCVLGTLLLERNAIHQVRELLTPNSFYFDFHREVYCAIIAMTDRGERADVLSIGPELSKRRVAYKPYDIVEVSQNSTFDITQYACRLFDLEKRRKFYDLGQYLIANGTSECEDIEDVLQATNDRLSAIFGDTVKHIRTATDYLTEVVEQVNNNLSGQNIPGTPTGF
ncbi:MAG: DnaB-like helicase N-terminal domain-containing protein, partial [Bacteroides sp.]